LVRPLTRFDTKVRSTPKWVAALLQSANSPARNVATALEISADLSALAMIFVVVVKLKKVGFWQGWDFARDIG
jgi:hypothetical protein